MPKLCKHIRYDSVQWTGEFRGVFYVKPPIEKYSSKFPRSLYQLIDNSRQTSEGTNAEVGQMIEGYNFEKLFDAMSGVKKPPNFVPAINCPTWAFEPSSDMQSEHSFLMVHSFWRLHNFGI